MMKKLWMNVLWLCLTAAGLGMAGLGTAAAQVVQTASPVSEPPALRMAAMSHACAPGGASGNSIDLRTQALRLKAGAERSTPAATFGNTPAALTSTAPAANETPVLTPGHQPAIMAADVADLLRRAPKSGLCDTIRLTTTNLDDFPINLIVVGSGSCIVDWGDGSTSTYGAVAEADSYEWVTARHSYNSSRVYHITMYGTRPGTRIMGVSLWFYSNYGTTGLGLLSDLDLSAARNLVLLDAVRQAFRSLDVSGCPALRTLSCRANRLSYLDVGGCPALRSLVCDSNLIEALYLNCPATLTELTCYDNRLTELDLNGYTNLTEVTAYDNALERLDITGCETLQTLYCQRNALTKLDAGGCTALSVLSCQNNRLESLDVSGCRNLWDLSCYDNALERLDVSGCEALQTLDCYFNTRLIELDVSGCESLQRLRCYNNYVLVSLNANGCASLQHLDCSGCDELAKLDVGGCTNLQVLYCYGNQLQSLDVSGCTNLWFLSCFQNRLQSLDASGCSALRQLYCGRNQLKSLDVSGCVVLDTLSCSFNRLSKLDLTHCTALTRLWCDSNRLRSLDLSACTDLCGFWCRYNALTELKLPVTDSLFVVPYGNSLSLSALAGIQAVLRQSNFSCYHLSPQTKSVSLSVGRPLDLTDEMWVAGRATDYTVFGEDGYVASSDLYTAEENGEVGRFRFKRAGTYLIRLTNPALTDNGRMVLDSAGGDWIICDYGHYSEPVYVYYEVTVKSASPTPPSEPDEPEKPNDPEKPTANEDFAGAASASSVWAYVQGRTIYVTDAVDVNSDEVAVYTTVGQRIYRGHGRAVEVPQAGVYILTAGEHRMKVLVR